MKNDLSIGFVAEFKHIRPAVYGVCFMWLCVVFLTTLLVSRTMTPIVAKQLAILDEYATITAMCLTILFGCFFSIVFEGLACWLVFQNEKLLSFGFAFASGLLAIFGMLQNLDNHFDFDSLNGKSTLLVYGMFGFAPPISLMVITKVLYRKLADNNLLHIFEILFIDSIKAYVAELKQPAKAKENPFVTIFKKSLTNKRNAA